MADPRPRHAELRRVILHGPHVLACAALLPDLVTAAASLASLAPFGAEGLDYFAGMAQDNVDDTRLFLTDEARGQEEAGPGPGGDPGRVARRCGREIESMLTPTDAALQIGAGEFHEFFLSCTQ
jgi:hypothetical protein